MPPLTEDAWSRLMARYCREIGVIDDESIS